MSDVQDYLLKVGNDNAAAAAVVQSTAHKLESKQTTLIDVVQSLGEYINNEDSIIRSEAVTYLSRVIERLPPAVLTRQQVQVLCQFLCDRIEDGGAIMGLQKLQSLARFNKEMAAMTFRAMLEHFQDLQLRPQAQRLQILELLNNLMSHHRPALEDMGDESIVGITNLVSGEKDPRNLMIIFSVLKVVMIEWDIAAHAETLFDAVYCYFPITFRPPPDDPYGITAQDLKGRLRECVAASDYFAPFAFPQLIDKLDSTSPNVKKDVLVTISACASSYGVSTMSNYAITLWDSLKYEILNVQEEDLADEALIALRAIAAKLSQRLTSPEPKTALARYLEPITKECNEQLQEPQHKQAKPAGQILSSLASASTIALFLVVKAIVPPLLTLIQSADTIANQRALLEVLGQLFDAAIAVSDNHGAGVPAAEISNPLDPFKDRLFELSSHALMSTAHEEVSFRVMALRTLLRLCTLPRYLQDNEIGMFVQYLNEIILLENLDGREDLKKEAIKALANISRIKPHLIRDITFPAFMAKLPDSNPADKRDYIVTLEGLARLSTEKSIIDTIIRRLLNKLDTVLQHEGSCAYPQAIISSLIYILNERDLTQDPNLSTYYEKIVVGLVSRAALAGAGHQQTPALTDQSMLETLGRLTTKIIRALDEHKQRFVGLQIYSLFTDDPQFVPVLYRNDATKAQRLTMILSTSLMAGVGKGIPLPYTDTETGTQNLLTELIRLALAESNSMIRLSILRQLASIVNKFVQPDDVLPIGNLWKSSISLLEMESLSESAIRVVFWIAKGLILRLANTTEVLEYLLSLLADPACSLSSARGFNVLLAPDEILSKENGATIRLLARQKVFNICAPSIIEKFRQAETSLKPNYLIALSGFLKYTPTEVLMPEIETLLPLLLQSLDLQDPDVQAATMENLMIVSQENPKAMEGHISSLTSRLLKAAAETKGNAPRVRSNALRCLRIFPGNIKDSALLPYKRAVTRGLMAVLDDPKRHVRKEAVECRSAWLNMDEPEEDD